MVPSMNYDTAKAILNDQAFISAYSFFTRRPMETSDETYRLATDWMQAALTISSNNQSR